MTSRRKMGEPDATAICTNCGLNIHRQWWGNGGRLWVHPNGRTECYLTVFADPAEGSIKELYPQ